MRYMLLGIVALAGISQAGSEKVVCNASKLQLFPKICKGPGNGAYILFADNRASSGAWEVYVQKMDGSLNRLWGQGKLFSHDPRVSTWHGHRLSGELVSSIKGSDTGAIGVWINHHKLKGGDYPPGVYARRISSSGSLDWDSTRFVSSTTSGFSVCSDGAGGCMIAWMEKSGGKYLIKAQKLDASGNKKWGTNGKTVRSDTTVAKNPKVVKAGVDTRGFFNKLLKEVDL